jgi:hypothetical protein
MLSRQFEALVLQVEMRRSVVGEGDGVATEDVQPRKGEVVEVVDDWFSELLRQRFLQAQVQALEYVPELMVAGDQGLVVVLLRVRAFRADVEIGRAAVGDEPLGLRRLSLDREMEVLLGGSNNARAGLGIKEGKLLDMCSAH